MAVSFLTKVEISSQNLLFNLQQFRKRIGPKVKLMAVVKANAYGHGVNQVAQIVAKNGVDWFGVNNLKEGLEIRRLGINLPVLILGYVPLTALKTAVENNLSLGVCNRETVENLPAEAKIHLKIETGINRQGIKLVEILDFVSLCQKKAIKIEGVYTHYANIEDTIDSSFAFAQLAKFKKVLAVLKKAKIKIHLRHTACSAAVILFPQTFFNMVRVGIGLYGFWPSKETKISAQQARIKLQLKPVLAWKTKVVQIKSVPKGETIGYGRTFKTLRKSKIAVLPVGYWDGYDRKLSNTGMVLIHGQFAPVVGRICMNMFMVDITDIADVKVEEEAVLIGRQGKNEITVEELAQKIGTINYEVVTRINSQIKREVV